MGDGGKGGRSRPADMWAGGRGAGAGRLAGRGEGGQGQASIEGIRVRGVRPAKRESGSGRGAGVLGGWGTGVLGSLTAKHTHPW